MNSRIYPTEIYRTDNKHLQKFFVRPITQADILHIKKNKNLETIYQLFYNINNKHCK
jgi:hypothetical protein